VARASSISAFLAGFPVLVHFPAAPGTAFSHSCAFADHTTPALRSAQKNRPRQRAPQTSVLTGIPPRSLLDRHFLSI
jgi:hypothetical protein